VNPNELAELRTLREIVEHMGNANGELIIDNGELTAVSTPVVEPQIAQAPAATSDLSDAMLVIVSEKTGYPVEMLELDMDMEADLGIDSIKRVEILGAMQEQHPELPEVNPNELAELRTLREIVEHMQGAGAGAEKKADPAVAGAGFSTQGNSVPAPSNHAITRNVVHVKSLPMPDFLAFAASKTAVCLLTDDGTALTTNVANALLGRGWKVAVLSFPQSLVAERAALPSGVQQVALDSMDEAELTQKLGMFNAPIGSFIHLNPVVRNGAAKGIVKTVFFIAKHLKAALNEAAATGRAAFMTVAQLDGTLGMDGGLSFNPINGGLFGLTKTMNLEWPNVYCRAVDLHPGIAPEQAVNYVLAELYDPNRLLVEVGYGNKGRVTLETAVSPLDPYTPSTNITPASVFVVSGGAKGITAQCTINLAKQYQCKFILLGRSSIAGIDTSWLGEYANEAELKRLIMNRLVATGEKPTPMAVNKIARSISSKHEIEGTLNAIAQTGGQAEYVSVDVTDGAGLKRELTAVSARLGQITGLIHGAGVLSDKLIEKKTDGDFEAVYSTKVHGLHALFQAIPPAQLSHLVLFSSAAGFYGNVGQADYALANDILNKTAHLIKREYPACHVVSIDWGPWDGGMVTPALKKLFAERNIPVIPVDVGAWILANELTEANAGVVQTVVGGELAFADAEVDGALQNHRLHRFLSVAANPFLNDHVIGGSPVLPTVCAIAWMGNACEQLYPGFTMASCEKYQVLKGIVFDDPADAPQEYILDLEETAKGDGSIAFKAIVSSQNGGKPRFHYRAEITLMATLPDAPIYANVDLSEQNPMDKGTLYSNGTLFHGADFQGVERVLNVSENKVTMRCHLPAQPDGEAGQFGVQSFNPFIADGQFQSMVIWARHFHDAGSLPLFTERGEQFRPIPFGETTYVSMEVRESSSSKLVADIITHDENGRVYARVLGAQVTISEQLNHLFVPSA